MTESGLSDYDRRIVLGLSFFPPDREILGVATRSLSIASHQWVKMVGLRCLDPFADMTPREELAQVSAYVWAHSADPDLVGESAWTGDWLPSLEYTESTPEQTLALVADWRRVRERVLSLVAATEIEVRPRPKGKNSEKIPSAVVGPSRLAHKIATVSRETGYTREEVLWHLPLWEANQIYHASLRRDGAWTTPVMERSSPDDFADFSVDALTYAEKPEEEEVSHGGA